MGAPVDVAHLVEDHFVRSWTAVGSSGGGVAIVTDDYQLTLSVLDHVPYNHVQRCTPSGDPETTIEDILQLIGDHEAIWSVPPSSSASGLKERLLARGFETYSLLTGMSLELDPPLPQPPAPPAVRIDEVGPADLEAYADLVLESWHLSEGDRATLLAMNRDIGFERMRRWVCYSDGRAVAKCVAFLHEPEVAGIYGVGTLPDVRGQGYASILMCEVLRALRVSGVETAVLQSTPIAVDLYRRLGFREHLEIPVYTVPRSQPPTERMTRV
jgi:GNAT superfamily N-acetyltransferase